MNSLIKEFSQELQKIRSHDTWTAFSDLMELSACSLQKPFEYIHKKDVDTLFNKTINKYRKDEQDVFPKLLSILISFMEQNARQGKMKDVVGTIFGELNLIDKKTGQFFTPNQITDVTSCFIDDETIKNAIDKKGYISLCEPSCGAGAMILSFATRLIELGYNPQNTLLIEATDIDRRCVNMCFTQLSYYGLSAIITHGNTLSLECWDKLYTPFYIMNKWRFK